MQGREKIPQDYIPHIAIPMEFKTQQNKIINKHTYIWNKTLSLYIFKNTDAKKPKPNKQKNTDAHKKE